jgi:hypothetical protein
MWSIQTDVQTWVKLNASDAKRRGAIRIKSISDFFLIPFIVLREI